MAAVLNFDRDEGPSRTQADAAIGVVIDHVSHLPARIAVPLLARYRTQIDAAEARALATVIDTTGNTKAAEPNKSMCWLTLQRRPKVHH